MFAGPLTADDIIDTLKQRRAPHLSMRVRQGYDEAIELICGADTGGSHLLDRLGLCTRCGIVVLPAAALED